MAVDGAHERLVVELRRVKQASGLSYARLQAHTPYSRSSLERYINGKLFPTRQAVSEIAQACGADPEELLKIWEVAANPPATPNHPVRQHRWVPTAALVFCLVALVLALVDGDQRVSHTPASASVAPTGEPREVWSRRLSIVTADGTKNGWLDATLDWQGDGPFDGRIYGSVHVRQKGDVCAAAYAWYDGKVTPIGQACGTRPDSTVFGSFRQTWRALVKVCLRRDSALEWCSAWS